MLICSVCRNLTNVVLFDPPSSSSSLSSSFFFFLFLWIALLVFPLPDHCLDSVLSSSVWVLIFFCVICLANDRLSKFRVIFSHENSWREEENGVTRTSCRLGVTTKGPLLAMESLKKQRIAQRRTSEKKDKARAKNVARQRTGAIKAAERVEKKGKTAKKAAKKKEMKIKEEGNRDIPWESAALCCFASAVSESKISTMMQLLLSIGRTIQASFQCSQPYIERIQKEEERRKNGEGRRMKRKQRK